ncbi:glycosyltransferase family 2 protein [Algibacter sp. PT7-4]|uniref:glycosyltransferase family 2 protein n=1 Tax=Algibacter ulvanivorans TaxID=3400999 RepID=UPI003AAE09C7
MDFSISVIIPAFNVERFIEKAIRSALQQSQVNEVVVVNDGSTDKTIEILESLKNENPKVKIYHHKNQVNLGRSASRNLGIIKATENFIAFLDADDFYLKDRFVSDKKIFQSLENIDGVYNAVGFHFYRKAKTTESQNLKLNTLTKKLAPEDFFEAIIASKYGYLHLNGITVKASVFKTIGLFNKSLMVAEDSDIIFKMALKCRLAPSQLNTALALRGIHDNNVFNQEALYKTYNIKLYESLINWSLKNKISYKNIDVILNWLWFFKFRENKKITNYISYWFYLVINNPKLLFSKLSIKYFPIIRLRQKLFPFLFK